VTDRLHVAAVLRTRVERALTSVAATGSLLGVSTRLMEKHMQSLGLTSLSWNQVLEMTRELDAHVRQVRTHFRADAAEVSTTRPCTPARPDPAAANHHPG
jgi:hypothetical protein